MIHSFISARSCSFTLLLIPSKPAPSPSSLSQLTLTLQLFRTKPWGHFWLFLTHNQPLSKPMGSNLNMHPEADHFPLPPLLPPLPPGQATVISHGDYCNGLLIDSRCAPWSPGLQAILHTATRAILLTQQSEEATSLIKTHQQPWLVWLSGLSAGPRTKGSPVQFPVRAVGQVPS